MLQTAQHKNIT